MAKKKDNAPRQAAAFQGKGSYSRCIRLSSYDKGVIALCKNRVRKGPHNPMGLTDAEILKQMLVKLEYYVKDRTNVRYVPTPQPSTSEEAQ